MESLIELDKQCHEHLRDSNRKKDRMLGFYLTATYLILGFVGHSSDTSKPLFLIWLCFVSLVLTGICLGAVLTMYRGWHGFYILTSIVLQELIKQSKQTISRNFICNIKYKFNTVVSVEFLAFVFLYSFILLNIYMTFYINPSNNGCFDFPYWHNFRAIWISYILLGFAISGFIIHFIVMHYLDKWKINNELNEKYLWLLNGKIGYL